MSIEALKRFGINYRTGYKEDDTNVIAVQLELSPQEWFDVCTRDGPEYFGPCCGNTGASQDILCAAFRDNGWIDADDLITMHVNLSNHEGFEALQAAPKKKPKNWIEKLSRIWHSAVDVLQPNREIIPHKIDLSDPRGALSAAKNGLFLISWDTVMGSEDKSGQRHANRELLLARVHPPLKFVVDNITKYSFGSFEGFALVEPGTETPLINRMGLCLYSSIESAKEIIGWSQKADAKVVIDICECRVTIEDGLKIGRVVGK